MLSVNILPPNWPHSEQQQLVLLIVKSPRPSFSRRRRLFSDYLNHIYGINIFIFGLRPLWNRPGVVNVFRERVFSDENLA